MSTSAGLKENEDEGATEENKEDPENGKNASASLLDNNVQDE